MQMSQVCHRGVPARCRNRIAGIDYDNDNDNDNDVHCPACQSGDHDSSD
jgi:hypothetical protein